MDNYIGKCGCNCSNCPTYKENIRTFEDRHRCSAGWEKYLNIKLSPEKLRACDGCSVPDSLRKTYYLNCKVRKCAMINDLKNCAYCIGFPCEELLKVHSLQKIADRNEFTEKTGKEISKSDYELFIEPYVGLRHLNIMRQSISENELIEYKKFSTNNKFSPFPKFKNKSESLKLIYSILTSICAEQNISFARFQTLKSKREKLVKILWIMARDGKLDKDNGCLELDSRTFLSSKIQGMYNPLMEYFGDLKQYNIHCEIIPLVNSGWLTPKGGLRNEGWIIRLSFEKSLMAGNMLKEFRDYAKKLDNTYREKAFRVFTKADLSIMMN